MCGGQRGAVMTPTEERIIQMLKENTGRHFLDSGGAYGRHWERNQHRDFLSEPPCKTEIRWKNEREEDGKIIGDLDEVLIVYNIFHFLNNFLDWDETAQKIEKEFYEFATSDDYKKETWEDCLDAFCKTRGYVGVGGAYTYNYETILSQDIIYNPFETNEGDELMIIRVHNGCDARGGFTSPAFFSLVDDNDYFLLAMNDVYASCKGYSPEMKAGVDGLFDLPYERCPHNWSSDDGGHHWYYNGCCPSEKELFDMVHYDVESGKVICNDCKGVVEFHVMEGC